MEYITIPDTAVFAVNCGVNANEASNIIYRDKQGNMHQIDFETCAMNYKAEHPNASAMCVGVRNISDYSFVFYTSGIKTKIVFDKRYVGNLFRYHYFSGTRSARFLALQKRIYCTSFTTYDFS